MSDFSASDVAFTGIRFVRYNLPTVAIWAGVQIVLSLVSGALLVSTMGPLLAQLQAIGPRPDPAQAQAMMQQMLPLYGVLLPISLVFYAVIYATMNRAVMRPAESGFGYIRLGMDEVRQFLLILLFALVGGGIYIACILGVVVLTLIGAALGPVGMALMSVVGVLATLAVMLYVMTRLSLASAQTFDRKRITFFKSWELTKGRFWKIFGAYLLAFVVAIVVAMLIFIIDAAVTAVVGGVGGLTKMLRPDTTSLAAYFAPVQIVNLVVWGLATPMLGALMLMPAPEIYRHLSGAADPALDPSTFD